jgi:hypothetical protein
LGLDRERSTATRSRTCCRSPFLDDAIYVVPLGPSGIGKTMIAQNLGQQALQRGHTVR